MKHERHRRTPNNYIWSRILERYRCRRGLFRPRVPLVLRRHGVLPRPGSTKKNGRPNISHYQFAFHLHLSSLWWLSGPAGQYAPQASDRFLTALQILLKQADQAAGRPMRTSGSALRGHDVMRSWSETPSSYLPSVRVLSSHTSPSHALFAPPPSSHTPSARTKSAPTLSACALPSTTPSSNATRSASTGTSALRSEPRHVSLQRISSPSLWYARSGRAGRFRAPKAIPHRVTRQALLTHSVLAEILLQRHLQHRVETADASREVLHRGIEVIRRLEVIKGVRENQVAWAASARRSIRTGGHDIGDPLGSSSWRVAPTNVVQRTVSVPFHPVLVTALQSSQRQVEQTGEGRPSVVEGMRSPLYAQPAARSFANQPAVTAAQQTTTPEQRSASPPPSHAQALQPQIDLGRLSEDVYQHIQRKIRIERERRGL